MSRIYEYRCLECGAELEAVREIEQRRTHAPLCCGQLTQIEIRTPRQGYVDNMAEYICPVTRKPITTRRQRNYVMEENYLIDANDYLQTDEQRAAKAAKAQAERERIAAQKAKEPDIVKQVALESAMQGF